MDMKKVRLWSWIALVLLGVFVLIQNSEDRGVHFLFWHFYWPGWLLYMLILLLGMGLGWLVSATVRKRRSSEEF